MRNYIESGNTRGVDEVTRRGNGSGEHISSLPSGYIDAYKAGLEKLGVCPEDIESNAGCLTDTIARQNRASTKKTVESEVITSDDAFLQVNALVRMGRELARNEITNGGVDNVRTFRRVSPILVATESTRRANAEAARELRNPLRIAKTAIEDLARVTHVDFKPMEPVSIPIASEPVTVFIGKRG